MKIRKMRADHNRAGGDIMEITKRYGSDLFLHTGYGLVSRSIKSGKVNRRGNALLYFAAISAALLLIMLRT